MAISYNKLWKLLIDKDMKKKDLCAKAGISPASVTKMGKNGHVTTEILLKICTALNCGVDEIMEILPDQSGLSYIYKLEIMAIQKLGEKDNDKACNRVQRNWCA